MQDKTDEAIGELFPQPAIISKTPRNESVMDEIKRLKAEEMVILSKMSASERIRYKASEAIKRA